MDTSGYETLLVRQDGSLLTVTLNRPELRNATNNRMEQELCRVFGDANHDPEVLVVIVTGAGQTFSAGGDFEYIRDNLKEPSKGWNAARWGKQIVFSMLECSKPIIARINGHAVGFGATLALFCDITIAVDSAKIGDPHVAVGLVAATLVPSLARPSTSYIVGAKTFAEQYVLSQLVAQRLRAAGLSAGTREGLGSSVIFEALASGDIDVYIDYSGTLWANQFHRSDVRPRGELLGELTAILAKQNVTLLGELGFENAYALVMPRKRAEELGIKSIADLVARAPSMSIAGDYEFFSRPEWTALQRAYGLSFRTQRTMQPDFMYAAVASGEVDVIAGYTSDGLIAKYDLIALDDPKRAVPPYDAIVLLAPKRAGDEKLKAALQPLLGRIDISAMREANLRAAGNDAASSPEAVARWLWEKVGRR